MPSLRFTTSVVDTNGGTVVTGNKTVTDEWKDDAEYSIGASQTDYNITVAWATADLKGFTIHTDQAILIEVNTTGNNPVNLAADEALTWNGTGTNPLGASNITALLITTTVAAVVKIRAIRDNAP